MSRLEIPDEGRITEDRTEIIEFLASVGIHFDLWNTTEEFAPDASQKEIFAAYQHVLDPYMKEIGYTVADVIRIQPNIANLAEVRQKFLREHTHSEDEIRYFIEGKGYFWFNLEGDTPVFAVLCEQGDLISVPAGAKHWFDMGAAPQVAAIRIFIDPSGWVPHYTGSDVAERYNKPYDTVI